MNERFNIQNQVEHLQMKYVGTGHADLTQWYFNNSDIQREWGTNIKRDRLASNIGHHSRMVYFAVSENETVNRLRNKFTTNMIQPCGPPPQKKVEQ